MKSTVRWTLFVIAVLLAVGTPTGAELCMDQPDYVCATQCTWIFGGLYCFDRSDQTRCCFESGTGNVCGEVNPCEECIHCHEPMPAQV